MLVEKHLPVLAINGSESVLNYLYYLRHYQKKSANTLELLFLCENLVNVIRKELGQKEIESGRILSIYRNETAQMLRKRRERLSGVPHFRIF